MKILHFEYDDIFQDHPTNSEKILMTIPEEIRTMQGWNEGDVLTFEIDETTRTMTIRKFGDKGVV